MCLAGSCRISKEARKVSLLRGPRISALHFKHFTPGGEWGVGGHSGPELNSEWSPRLVLFDLQFPLKVLWPL